MNPDADLTHQDRAWLIDWIAFTCFWVCPSIHRLIGRPIDLILVSVEFKSKTNSSNKVKQIVRNIYIYFLSTTPHTMFKSFCAFLQICIHSTAIYSPIASSITLTAPLPIQPNPGQPQQPQQQQHPQQPPPPPPTQKIPAAYCGHERKGQRGGCSLVEMGVRGFKNVWI